MDNRRRARLVENATNQSAVVLRDENPLSGERRECAACGQSLGTKPGPLGDWDAFPAGVKFDPSDEELLQHLKAEIGLGTAKSHPLISNFISVLDGEDGICQTHPEHLPGVKKDGSSRHFFHRPAKAYTTGTRKRRKIHSEDDEPGVETRWHKTGKTRPVCENGQTLGWKKIMVLYRNTGLKKSKPEKTNWILHQYHLGQHEEETDGELVVCKVFYQKQPRQCTGGRQTESTAEMETVDLNSGSKDRSLVCVSEVSRGAPATPKVDAPHRPRSTRLPSKEVFPNTNGKIRCGPTQSSKDSELTVIGMDAQVAPGSEQTSIPFTQKSQALIPCVGSRMFAIEDDNPTLLRSVPQTLNEDYCMELSDPGRIVSGDFNPNLLRTMPLPAYEEYSSEWNDHGESQLPFQDDDTELFACLRCDEELGSHSFLSEVVINLEYGGPEEPCVSNPNADYPPIDDILTDTPPSLNMDLILSSQEVMDVIYQKPVYTSLDNEDSLSST